MSGNVIEQGDVNWKTVMTRLGQGLFVEIPCEDERELDRRTTQVIKRAEKQKLKVEILRGERSLRIEPPVFLTAEAAAAARKADERKKRKRARRKRRKAAGAKSKPKLAPEG